MHMFEWCITRTSSCELYMCLANNWPCIFECMDLFVPMYEWDGSGQVPVHFVCVVQITVLVSLQLECSNKRTALCTMYSNTPLAHTLLHPTFCHRTTHQGEHKALLHNCCLSLSLSGGGGGGGVSTWKSLLCFLASCWYDSRPRCLTANNQVQENVCLSTNHVKIPGSIVHLINSIHCEPSSKPHAYSPQGMAWGELHVIFHIVY